MKHLTAVFLVVIACLTLVSCQKEPLQDCSQTVPCWYSSYQGRECDYNGDGIVDDIQYVIDTTWSEVNVCNVTTWLYQTNYAINSNFNPDRPSDCGCITE